MREVGRFGAWRSRTGITPEMAARLEGFGYEAIWIGGSPGGDLGEIEALLDATRSITVATGIVNVWRDEPEPIAEAYHRLEAGYPNRFLLGVGVGHPEATREYRKPYATLVDYLDRLAAAGVPREATVLAALGPKVLGLAADRTAGAHPYLTTPRHTAMARRVLGPGPLLAPEQKVVLDLDVDRARLRGREIVGRYLDRVNYRNNLLREGWAESDLADGGSDALVDALVLHGGQDAVAEGIRAHLGAGADHVAIQVLGDDPVEDFERLAASLFG